MSEMLAAEPVFVTNPKSRVHIRACPHLSQDSRLTPATPEQIEENGYCTFCEAELLGLGRTYFTTLDDAFEAFGHRSDEAKRLIRSAIDGIAYDVIWIPPSEPYIGLRVPGEDSVWIGKGYVNRGSSRLVELPWFEAHSGGGSSSPETRGDLCAVHFIERSVTGTCEMCD